MIMMMIVIITKFTSGRESNDNRCKRANIIDNTDSIPALSFFLIIVEMATSVTFHSISKLVRDMLTSCN